MSVLESVILAVIQGVTEFLPISSSAHLALTPWLLGWKDQGLAFDIALHFGTLAAVIVYFFKDWMQIIAQAFGMPYRHDPELSRNRNLLWWLAAGSIPVGITGLLFKHAAETTFRSPYVIGFMLISVGLLMAAAERIGTRQKQIGTIVFWDALIVGAAQALAVVPGTSRSGITMVAGLWRSMDRHTAARFSFLLSTPAIAAAALKEFWDVQKAGGIPSAELNVLIIGIAVSGITGLVVIKYLLKFLRQNTFIFFVYYRIVFGIIVIALAFFRGPF